MAGFSTKAQGSAHYTKTTGIYEWSFTEGLGDYHLLGRQPSFIAVSEFLADGERVRYRVSSGIKQEIGIGHVDWTNNQLKRGRILIPNTGIPVNWGTGKKLVYITRTQE
jgi:hypothetical protein